jgi:hypothetical protein
LKPEWMILIIFECLPAEVTLISSWGHLYKSIFGPFSNGVSNSAFKHKKSRSNEVSGRLSPWFFFQTKNSNSRSNKPKNRFINVPWIKQPPHPFWTPSSASFPSSISSPLTPPWPCHPWSRSQCISTTEFSHTAKRKVCLVWKLIQWTWIIVSWFYLFYQSSRN